MKQKQILDNEVFEEIVVSDNAAAIKASASPKYAGIITCSAGASKLTLLSPAEQTYREFADTLLAIYRKAKQVAGDQRANSPQPNASGQAVCCAHPPSFAIIVLGL